VIVGLASRPNDPNLGELERTITVFPPVTVQGDLPPTAPVNWWPWIVAGVVLAGLWWITREERDRDGRRPFEETTSS